MFTCRGKKHFGQVPFDYGTRVYKGEQSSKSDAGIIFTAQGHLIPSSADFTRLKTKIKKKMSRRPKLELQKEGEVQVFLSCCCYIANISNNSFKLYIYCILL